MACSGTNNTGRPSGRLSNSIRWALLLGACLVLFAVSLHGLAGPLASASKFDFVVAEGLLARSEVSICMAGDTHVLIGTGVFLRSSRWPGLLDAYVGRHVRVRGEELPSPECRLINVVGIEPIDGRRLFLPVVFHRR